MSWLAQCVDRLMPRIQGFFLLWFDAYGRISPLPLSNFSEAEQGEAKPPATALRERDPCPRPTAVRFGRHLTIVGAD
jgi:hypothetical protein